MPNMSRLLLRNQSLETVNYIHPHSSDRKEMQQGNRVMSVIGIRQQNKLCRAETEITP